LAPSFCKGHGLEPKEIAMQENISLIDINELSKRISIPKGTLYNLVYLRRIPFVKRGRSLRFDPDEVIRSLPHYTTMDTAGQRWKGH
jgi:excisionase family DNA binding protein